MLDEVKKEKAFKIHFSISNNVIHAFTPLKKVDIFWIY